MATDTEQIEVITQRDRIRTAAARWKDQYFFAGKWEMGDDKRRIGKALAALDPETATAAAVNKIIGNDSWTTDYCMACRASVADTIAIPDWGESANQICIPCAQIVGKLASLSPS